MTRWSTSPSTPLTLPTPSSTPERSIAIPSVATRRTTRTTLGSGQSETDIVAGITIPGGALCKFTNVIHRLDTESAREFLAGSRTQRARNRSTTLANSSGCSRGGRCPHSQNTLNSQSGIRSCALRAHATGTAPSCAPWTSNVGITSPLSRSEKSVLRPPHPTSCFWNDLHAGPAWGSSSSRPVSSTISSLTVLRL